MAEQPRQSKRNAMLAAALALAALAVVIIALTPTGKGALRPENASGAASPPLGPGQPQEAALAWTQASDAVQFMVRAEEAALLVGQMVLEEGEDNEGVLDPSGTRAKVRYVWCPNAGLPQAEPEELGAEAQQDAHRAVFEFTVPRTAVYYPWARVWWEDSCGNSVTLIIEREGTAVAQYVVQGGTMKWWHWLPVGDQGGVTLQQGPHTLIVQNREDGARVSRVLFTTRSPDTYIPQTPEG